jgi:hypothetical protein
MRTGAKALETGVLTAVALATVACLSGPAVCAPSRGSVVNIFRVQIDRPNPTDFFNAIEEVNFEGTVFFRSLASGDLQDVQMRVTMYDLHYKTYSDSRSYAIGIMKPDQMVQQDYRLRLASETYLVPVVSVTWSENGVRGETHTSPYDHFY